MSSGIYAVARTGLQAAQLGMQTTGHNLANVNTAGFSRQEIVQVQGNGQLGGTGFVGTGTNVTSVRRIYADYLVTQTQVLQSQDADFQAQAGEMGRLSDLLADPDVNLGVALDGFFGAIEELATSPNDTVARQGMLSGGEALAARFQDLESSFADMQARVDGQIRSSVDLINGYAQSIARLNSFIADAQGSGQPPNDLLDQRDTLISQMNQEVRAVVVPDGTINLFLTNGQPIVLGSSALKLVLTRDDLDPTRLAIGVQSGDTLQMFRQGDITGGALGGMLAFRDQTLAAVRNEVGRLAIAFGSAFNDQHRLGIDRNGQAGADFFAGGAPAVAPSSKNTGSATISASITDHRTLTANDYLLTWDGSNYHVTTQPGGAQATWASLPQTVGGVTIDIAGTPAAGDRFLIQPVRGGAAAMKVAVAGLAQIATGAPVRAQATPSNAGSGTISLGNVTSLDANLAQPVTITFTTAGTFDVSGTGTGNPTGLAFTPGMSLAWNGWSVVLGGSPRPGDSFTIGSNNGAAGDNRNALQLAGLSQGSFVNGQSASSAYARLVGSIGARTQEINLKQRSQQRLLEGAQQALASVSGVNLDEEAANLLRYQQAYQAAGKVIAVANTLFDALLASVN